VPVLVLPVIEPLIPATDADTVTLDAVPLAVTTPVVLTLAQALELCQDAELVTSLLPELKAATALRVAVGAAEKLVPPVLVVTVTEFGWLIKNPRQPAPTAVKTKPARAATASFRPYVRGNCAGSLIIDIRPTSIRKPATKQPRKILAE
jgi:hypothetical protein